MARKFGPGEGSEGLFLKTLTECVGRLGAIDPAKKQALIESFHTELAKHPRVAENPKEALRHEGTILERLFSNKAVVQPPAEPAKPKDDIVIPTSPAGLADLGLSDFDIESPPGFEIEPEPANPYTVEGGPLAQVLEEWSTSRKHPFVRRISIPTGKTIKRGSVPVMQDYLVLGTAVVHYPDGSSVNINATTGNVRKIRECDETVLVHFNGRPVSMQKDTDNGTCFFVWLCHYTPGKVFRFWMNRLQNGTRKDDPRGAIRVLITPETPAGWRKVAA
jgi:hypothetical protein